MTKAQKLLADTVVYKNYAKYRKDFYRRETFEEVVKRSEDYFVEQFPNIELNIREAFQDVYDRKILPSMRMMQFAGKPIDLIPNRGYNCSYLNIDDYHAFSEMMFLLLGGSGVGFSVRKRHISKLPAITKPSKPKRYMVGDDIKGWADAVKALFEAYMFGKYFPRFDFSDIRPKGSPLRTTGGRAPGSAPLEKALKEIEIILRSAVGRRLDSVEVFDISCYIADAVMAGGIRRSATICLFDFDDNKMLTAKTGDWATTNIQRCRANISVALDREDPKVEEKTEEVLTRCRYGGYGEPGIVYVENQDYGYNPCGEIYLEDCSMCNLVEVLAEGTLEDITKRVLRATILATLQATFTDFWYLRKKWQRNLEKNPLIGVSFTGLAGASEETLEALGDLRNLVRTTNMRYAEILDINPASRVTCVKPAGSTSLVMGTASGIHAFYAPYYYRTIQIEKESALGTYFLKKLPSDLYEDCFYDPKSIVVQFPIKSPDDAVTVPEETLIDSLDRILRVNSSWIGPDFENSKRRNNVSCSVYVKPTEWEQLGNFLKRNYQSLGGMSVFPIDDNEYTQPVFKQITEEEYLEMERLWDEVDIDFAIIPESDDLTDRQGAVACAGGGCEIS